jgi:nucleoside-diphosphate-sugar epimerase
VRKGRFPLVGDGNGIMPFIHLHDAAAATVLALDAVGPALYNITDDEPAPMHDWLPGLATAVGAKPPRHVPAWLAGLLMGGMLPVITQARGASNAKARKELDWTPRYPSWRQGFAASFTY